MSAERAVNNSRVILLGFSYKENVGDSRGSPVIPLVEELKKKNARIHIFDPYIEDRLMSKYGEVERDVYQALEGADAIVLITAHKEVRKLDLNKAKEVMRTPILIDGRRIFDPKEAVRIGFKYKGIGLGNRL